MKNKQSSNDNSLFFELDEGSDQETNKLKPPANPVESDNKSKATNMQIGFFEPSSDSDSDLKQIRFLAGAAIFPKRQSNPTDIPPQKVERPRTSLTKFPSPSSNAIPTANAKLKKTQSQSATSVSSETPIFNLAQLRDSEQRKYARQAMERNAKSKSTDAKSTEPSLKLNTLN